MASVFQSQSASQPVVWATNLNSFSVPIFEEGSFTQGSSSTIDAESGLAQDRGLMMALEDDGLLVAVTPDGFLAAVDPNTGTIVWPSSNASQLSVTVGAVSVVPKRLFGASLLLALGEEGGIKFICSRSGDVAFFVEDSVEVSLEFVFVEVPSDESTWFAAVRDWGISTWNLSFLKNTLCPRNRSLKPLNPPRGALPTVPANFVPVDLPTPGPTLPSGVLPPTIGCVNSVEAAYPVLVDCLTSVVVNVYFEYPPPTPIPCQETSNTVNKCKMAYLEKLSDECSNGVMLLESVLDRLLRSEAFDFCSSPQNCADGTDGQVAMCFIKSLPQPFARWANRQMNPVNTFPAPANGVPIAFTYPGETPAQRTRSPASGTENVLFLAVFIPGYTLNQQAFVATLQFILDVPFLPAVEFSPVIGGQFTFHFTGPDAGMYAAMLRAADRGQVMADLNLASFAIQPLTANTASAESTTVFQPAVIAGIAVAVAAFSGIAAAAIIYKGKQLRRTRHTVTSFSVLPDDNDTRTLASFRKKERIESSPLLQSDHPRLLAGRLSINGTPSAPSASSDSDLESSTPAAQEKLKDNYPTPRQVTAESDPRDEREE